MIVTALTLGARNDRQAPTRGLAARKKKSTVSRCSRAKRVLMASRTISADENRRNQAR